VVTKKRTGKEKLQMAAAQAIREQNTFLIVNALFKAATSASTYVPLAHRFVADDVSELRASVRGMAERQKERGLTEGGLVVLSGHSIAGAAFYLENEQTKSIEWVTVGQLAREFHEVAPGIDWVLLNVCFPASLLESRHRIPARLQGREGVGYHQPAPRRAPVFVAPRPFGSSIFGISALDGGQKPVTEPLIEMLAGRVTTRAFPLDLTREQALRLVKGDDRLYERLDTQCPDHVFFTVSGARQAVSIWSTPAELDAFRRFSGSAGIRTGRREYLLAAQVFEQAGMNDEAARLRGVFGSKPDGCVLPTDVRVSQKRVVDDLWEAACSVTPDFAR